MGRVQWDQDGQREYQTGTDRGMVYSLNSDGSYGVKSNDSTSFGVAWNGLTGVTQSPSGAESNAIYADNIKYLNLLSAEEFAFTITAYTYPDEFEQCDGSADLTPGVSVGQQKRRKFGFSYRNLIGNDTDGNDHGYEINCIYGAQAGVSERAHTTVNDSPEAVELSWECSTTPVAVGKIGNKTYKPTSIVKINSTDFTTDEAKAKLAAFEDIIYGRDADSTADPAITALEPTLPLPAAIYAHFTGNEVTQQAAG